MKKNFILAAAAAAILGAGTFFSLKAQNSERELSDVEVANIEALADEENSGEEEYAKNCIQSSSGECKISPYNIIINAVEYKGCN